MAEYVFIPDEGADRAQALASLAGVVAGLGGTAFHVAGGAGGESRPRGRRQPPVRILDVYEPTGAALVKATGNRGNPPEVSGGALHPVVNYTTAIAVARLGRSRLAQSIGPAGADMFSLQLRSSRDGAPLAGAVVHLRLKGSSHALAAVSDATGLALFGMRAPMVKRATVLVEPGFHGHWGYLDRNADLASGAAIEIDPVDLALAPDVLREMLRPGEAEDGAGVVVGVIDTGVGPHRDLPNVRGDADSSRGHGTHVAGIIAGRGTASNGGLAPGAEIRSYRVFDDAATGVAKNFDIHKAIETAAADGCHLMNLSLKSERDLDPRYDDRVISKAIEDAANRGVLAIAAAGNDFRRYVAFPARHRDVLSVSAFGTEKGLPSRAYDRWTVSPDRGTPNRDAFFTTFSNQGVDDTTVDLIGPGAGVVSTVPGNRYAPMSGTSMACPAAVGAIARVLSRKPEILAMPADRQRMEAMRNAALGALTPLGFSISFQGGGMVA